MTPDELAHYHEHGWVIARDILTDADFAHFERDYSALVAAKADELLARGEISDAAADADFAHRLQRVAAQCSDEVLRGELGGWGLCLDTMYALQRGCFELFFSERLLATIEQVVGPEITLNPIQHCRPYLPARGGTHAASGAASLTPWHQDQGVTREEADASEILTCWLPLVDVTAATGCLQVLPDRVAGGLLNHVKSDYGTTIDPALLPPGTAGVDCEMRRGDLLLMNRFTPHRGQLNTTDVVRWSLDLRFQKTGTPTGRHFWPAFVLRSAAAPGSVQDDYGEWCERWRRDLEASKVRAPVLVNATLLRALSNTNASVPRILRASYPAHSPARELPRVSAGTGYPETWAAAQESTAFC